MQVGTSVSNRDPFGHGKPICAQENMMNTYIACIMSSSRLEVAKVNELACVDRRWHKTGMSCAEFRQFSSALAPYRPKVHWLVIRALIKGRC